MAAPEPQFRYWREPLFRVALVVYLANTLVFKPVLAPRASFVNCYLGDCLCLPVCVPVTLWLQRRLGVRDHDRAPGLPELLLLWSWWSCWFEVIGPELMLLAPGAVRDPWDVCAYLVGGLLAHACWRRRGVERAAVGARRHAAAVLVGRMLVATGVALLVLSAYRLAQLWR